MDAASFVVGLCVGAVVPFGLWWRDFWREGRAEAKAKAKAEAKEKPKTEKYEIWYWLLPGQMSVMRDRLFHWLRTKGHGVEGSMVVTFRVIYENEDFKLGSGSWWKVCLEYSDPQGRDLMLQKIRAIYHGGLSSEPGPWCADPEPATVTPKDARPPLAPGEFYAQICEDGGAR